MLKVSDFEDKEIVIFAEEDKSFYEQVFNIEETLSFNSQSVKLWWSQPGFKLYGIIKGAQLIGMLAATQNYEMLYKDAQKNMTKVICTYLSAGYIHPNERKKGFFEKLFDFVITEEEKRGAIVFGAIVREERSKDGMCPVFFSKRRFQKIGTSTIHKGPALLRSDGSNTFTTNV